MPYLRIRLARDAGMGLCEERDLRLLDDAKAFGLADNGNVERDESDCLSRSAPPPEASSTDPDVLRAALIQEHDARRRADCLAPIAVAPRRPVIVVGPRVLKPFLPRRDLGRSSLCRT